MPVDACIGRLFYRFSQRRGERQTGVGYPLAGPSLFRSMKSARRPSTVNAMQYRTAITSQVESGLFVVQIDITPYSIFPFVGQDVGRRQLHLLRQRLGTDLN
jgi:hypothetical protein